MRLINQGVTIFFFLSSQLFGIKTRRLFCIFIEQNIRTKTVDQIKVDMEGCHIRTHTNRTTDGKVFITFIALLIRAYMLGKLDSYLATDSSSLKKCQISFKISLKYHYPFL
jgi:hypothetical protein